MPFNDDNSKEIIDDVSGGSLGLSLVAYFTADENVAFGAEVYEGGRRIDLKAYSADGGKQTGGGKREKVSGFSKASRHRLFKKLAALNQERAGMPIFVTLTYPNEFPADFETYKRHLDTWSKRLARRYPDAFFIWRLEFQKRGAPHYHLLLFGVERIDKDWLSRSWYEAVGSGDEKHLRAGTTVERIRSWKKTWSYCGKYLGKVDAGHGENGRVWGVYNRKEYDMCVSVEYVSLSRKAFYQARRILAKATGYSLRGCDGRQGLVAFVDADFFSRLFDNG